MASLFAKVPRVLIVAAVLLLGAVALMVLSPEGKDGPPPGNLEGSSVGGPYRLLSEDGAPVTEASFPGQWKLYYFGFTFCPDICPTDAAKLGQALAAFEAADPARAAKVQPLFVSVDPERDTPQALREFTDAFHPRLVGLTGTPEQSAAMLKAFRVFAQKQPGATPDSYLVDHSALYYLFDPGNRPIAFLTPLTAGPDDIVAMLDRHVR